MFHTVNQSHRLPRPRNDYHSYYAAVIKDNKYIYCIHSLLDSLIKTYVYSFFQLSH